MYFSVCTLAGPLCFKILNASDTVLAHAKVAKDAHVLQSTSQDQASYTLGTVSEMSHAQAAGVPPLDTAHPQHDDT